MSRPSNHSATPNACPRTTRQHSWEERCRRSTSGSATIASRAPFPQSRPEEAMTYDISPPNQRPEPGYYYHFKHDPAGPLNNYAYFIYGVGHHTEDDCRTEDSFMQVYRPLYENSYAYRNGGLFDLRPLYMFHKPAIREGREVPRFTKITDPVVIAELQAIKTRMYGDR